MTWLRSGKSWLAEIVFTSLPALCAVAITVGIFLHSDRITEFRDCGYLGAFLASVVSNATIFLPVPGGLITVGLGAILSPFLVALAAGARAGTGEMSGYVLGHAGGELLSKTRTHIINRSAGLRNRGFSLYLPLQ